MIKDMSYQDSLFALRQEGETTYLTVPKNIESFADNLFLISILKLSTVLGWTLQLSSKELETKVLESSENGFIAGFIAGSVMNETGPYTKGNTRFTKGFASYQTYSVECKYGKVPHLRTGGMDNLLSRLSEMKGFTKDYWGLRGSLAAILRKIPATNVSDLKTYVLPKSEVVKHIKTKLPYENGGLFRSEEIAYLEGVFSKVKLAINNFVAQLENPTEDFAENFMERYIPLKTKIEQTEKTLKLKAVNRSKVLFPAGKKKSITKFKQETLENKIEILMENHEDLFVPESMPGIQKIDKGEGKTPYNYEWRNTVYGDYSNSPTAQVINSWYDRFKSDEDE